MVAMWVARLSALASDSLHVRTRRYIVRPLALKS